MPLIKKEIIDEFIDRGGPSEFRATYARALLDHNADTVLRRSYRQSRVYDLESRDMNTMMQAIYAFFDSPLRA